MVEKTERFISGLVTCHQRHTRAGLGACCAPSGLAVFRFVLGSDGTLLQTVYCNMDPQNHCAIEEDGFHGSIVRVHVSLQGGTALTPYA